MYCSSISFAGNMNSGNMVNILISVLVGLVVICVMLIQEMRREHTEVLMFAIGMSNDDIKNFRENKMRTLQTMEKLLTRLKENEERQKGIENLLSKIEEKIYRNTKEYETIVNKLENEPGRESVDIKIKEKLTEFEEKSEQHMSENHKILKEAMTKLYENENKQEEMKQMIQKLGDKVDIQLSKENTTQTHTYIYNDQHQSREQHGLLDQHERCTPDVETKHTGEEISLISVALGFLFALVLFAVVWFLIYKHPFEGKQQEAGSFLLTTVVISAMHSMYYLFVVFQAAVGYVFS